MAAGKKRGLPGPGRTLEPRTDTERLNLLVELVGFGRGRSDVSMGWGGDHGEGWLELHAGPARSFQKLVAEDPAGDLRQLLDRALSNGAGAKPRAKIRSRRRS